MQGWIELKKKILQSHEQRTGSFHLPRNSKETVTRMNGSRVNETRRTTSSTSNNHINQQELELSPSDSLTNCLSDTCGENSRPPSVVSVASTSVVSNDEPTAYETASSSNSTASSPSSTSVEHLSVSSNSLTERKSAEILENGINQQTATPLVTEDISDDEILLIDLEKEQPKPIEALVYPPFIHTGVPLATDLHSLPGNSEDDLRDIRFLDYNDEQTLSLHLKTCLSLDRESVNPMGPYENSTDSNCLKRLFRLAYLKSLRVKKRTNTLFEAEKRSLPLSMIDSSTKVSFRTDWNVNRRHSASANRQKPKNIFHILQLNPTTKFSSSMTNSGSALKALTPEQANEQFEKIKDILARVYCPHIHKAIESGYHFGYKPKVQATQSLLVEHNETVKIKEMPVSPEINNSPTTITLRSPPSYSLVSSSSLSFDKKQYYESDEFLPITTPSFSQPNTDPEVDEENQMQTVQDSIIVLSPAQTSAPPSPEIKPDQSKDNNNPKETREKRKTSVTSAKIAEGRKKKRIIASPPHVVAQSIENISEPESDVNDKQNVEEQDTLPIVLPKPIIINNGLRSVYYKTDNLNPGRTSSHRRRRRRISSSSLPSFYTGLFETDNSAYVDFRLPFDIYWTSQQKEKTNTSSLDVCESSTVPSQIEISNKKKRKKSHEPKQKHPPKYKEITRNRYTEQLRQSLLSSSNAEKTFLCSCKPSGNCEDGYCLNKMTFTECPKNCVCGPKCSNQKIRNGVWCKNLEVFSTNKYGQGVRATGQISRGTFLCEYVGEIISKETFRERMIDLYSQEEHHYTMMLTQNLVIDAYRMGSIARFANHSCSPNCELQKWTVDGLPRLCLFALRPIKAGEEITYDYNFHCFDLQTKQPCYCESSKCRGFISTRRANGPTTNTSTNGNQNAINSMPPRLGEKEEKLVQESSIFLLRNLRRAKRKLEKKRKTIEQKRSPSKTLFFFQNFYHLKRNNTKIPAPNLRRSPKPTHRELFALFHNFIRRSHFYKTGRIRHELVDELCYYAQLAQLNLLLTEIFDVLINYKSQNDSQKPSNILKKCPSKYQEPIYYRIVKNPIDLAMMKMKLSSGEYSSFELFENDFLLMIENSITYCGTDSPYSRSIKNLKNYFLHTLKIDYRTSLELFKFIIPEQNTISDFEHFIERFHQREVIDGQARQALYNAIYQLDDDDEEELPVISRFSSMGHSNVQRSSRFNLLSGNIVHCRCGSNIEETSLVQCYACQLWQHVSCVSIGDSNGPYYCFECQPACEFDSNACLKTNVFIPRSFTPVQLVEESHPSYTMLTRSDGLIIRVNESYFVPKQNLKNMDPLLVSAKYDILCVERLWIDDYGNGQAAGFYYVRPNETFHEPSRRFFYNEVFRFPSSNDPLPISSFVRPCYVMNFNTYCRGRPISDNCSQVLSSDLFICEYRVDKTAHTFSPIGKSKYFPFNTKSYCFDTYFERLTVKRDYRHQEKYPRETPSGSLSSSMGHHDPARRILTAPTNRINSKQLEEKKIHLNGILHMIYQLQHRVEPISSEVQYSISSARLNTTLPSRIDNNNTDHTSVKTKKSVISTIVSKEKKPRVLSISSDDDHVEVLTVRDNPTQSKKRSRQTSPRKT